MKLPSPNHMEIKPNSAKTELQFRLLFPGPPKSIEFSLPVADAMRILRALQRLQELHKIPIPPELRPAGKPRLKIVTDDE